jgi:D-beta-D-heptose 7-phosphate kinase/D-beta-D-heptose 1-phosphate adenosyltransferase
MVLSRDDAVAHLEALRRRGMRTVFTNGVFDLLHPGHVRYLQAARDLGDLLVVGVNSDRSVRALAKGDDRPINPQSDRAELLSALTCVDVVVIFDEDTPHAIVTALQPDILVKGADWDADNIVGRDVVEARGGHVVRMPVVEGYSTTKLIERIKGATKTRKDENTKNNGNATQGPI